MPASKTLASSQRNLKREGFKREVTLCGKAPATDPSTSLSEGPLVGIVSPLTPLPITLNGPKEKVSGDVGAA